MSREDLDDPAHCIRAVERGSRTPNDLDAIDLIHRDELDGRRAGGRGRHLHSIDQHERLIRVGPAHENGTDLAEAAGVVGADTGEVTQKVVDRLRLARLDVLPRDYRRRPQSLLSRFRDARGGYQDIRVIGGPRSNRIRNEADEERGRHGAARGETYDHWKAPKSTHPCPGSRVRELDAVRPN